MLARDVHEPQILVAALLDLPRTECPVAVRVYQNRDDLPRRVGALAPAAVSGVRLRGVQLLEQVPIHETIVVVRQQVENVVGEELALAEDSEIRPGSFLEE